MSTSVDFASGQPFRDAHREKLGPRVGVVLTPEKAQLLLDKHRPGLRCLGLEYVDRGYNNRTYVLRVSDGSELIVRLGGRFWTVGKTKNEVACLTYVRHHCPNVPVPEVLFYSCDRKLVGAEYIGLEKMTGRPLDEKWPTMTDAERRCVLRRLADHFADLRRLRFERIGNLDFRSSPDGLPEVDAIFVGPCFDLPAGPFATYRQYVRAQFEDSLRHLARHPFFEPLRHLAPRVRTLLRDCCESDLGPSDGGGLMTAVVPDGPFVMTHYDFEPRNILVDDDNRPTAILDWEFSGAFPEDEEWMTGFEFLRANSAETTMGAYDQADPESDDLRDYFMGQLKAKDVYTPRTHPVRHSRRAELYVLKEELAPWYLREVEHDVPPEAYQQRTNASTTVDRILRKYGY